MNRIGELVKHPEFLENYRYAMGRNIMEKTLLGMKTNRMEMAVLTRETVGPKFSVYTNQGKKLELGTSFTIKV